MFPSVFLCSMHHGSSRKKKKNNSNDLEVEPKELEFWRTVQFNRDLPNKQNRPKVCLRSDNTYINRNGAFKAKKKGEMAARVSNFSDLIQRVTASCLLHPLANICQDSPNVAVEEDGELNDDDYDNNDSTEEELEEAETKARGVDNNNSKMVRKEKVMELETIMNDVFDAVSAMKRAYVNLQEAHCPWDPERMRMADVAVVGELRKIAVLRERFRRRSIGCGGGGASGGGLVREVVAPYEAAVAELKRDVKAREVEVDNLKEKLKAFNSLNNNGKNGRSFNKRRVNCSSQIAQVVAAPSPDLFEFTMRQVKESAKSFTLLLLSLMRAAHWDIAAAVHSIEAATANGAETVSIPAASIVSTQHAKYALESYISRKIFQGFDHETFYMDGSLSSLINPDQYRRDCFTQYHDMKAMDPVELLGILPTCHFGKFCSKKYLAIVHPKMEESLFGDVEQQRQVLAGNHPRSQFYGEFLGLAKAVWLLHLLAFSLEPAPCQFEASRGAEFYPQYMDSVVKFSHSRLPTGQVVAFPVSPGFKLGNGLIIKARVYLTSKT